MASRSHAAPAAHESEPLLAVPDRPAWHAIESWRQPQGLPQNSIITIRQTRDGYLWVGTKGGLTRFDGVRFTTFRKSRQVSETEVWDVAEAPDGTLWIATYGSGVAHLANGVFTQYSLEEGLPSKFVSAICVARDGVTWAATDKALARIEGGHVHVVTEKEGVREQDIRSVQCDDDGGVWIGTNEGQLYRHDKGRIVETPIPGPTLNSIHAVHRGPDDSLWVSGDTELLRLKDGVWTRFGEKDGLPATRGFRVHVDPRGNVWIGSLAGLFAYRDGTFVRHEVTAELTQKNNVFAMQVDHEGSLWIGHGGLGLVRMREGQFISYGTRHGLLGNFVRAIAEDSKDGVWIGTTEVLTRLRGGIFQIISFKDGQPFKSISSIGVDRKGFVWAGTNDGVYRIRPRDGCTGRSCPEDLVRMEKGGLARMTCRILYVDRQDDVWVGTDHGLARYHGDEITSYTTKEGLPDNAIRGLAEDAEGRLWIATKGRGIARLEADGTFRVLQQKDGLASDMTQALYTSRDGAVWIATREGVTRMKDGKLDTLTVDQGLYANHIYGIMEDQLGYLWMGCSRGVFRISMKGIEDVLAGRIASTPSTIYGLEHGLYSTVAAGGYYATIARTRDGRVWFAMADGLSVVDPSKLTANPLPPPVHLEEVQIDGQAFDPARAALAPPGNGDLEFRYTALTYTSSIGVRFKVRLEPYDRDWVDVENMRVKQYTNIPPGRYKFRVIAANSDGVWNEKGDGFEVNLAPHFYQTYWFYALCAAGTVLLGAGTQRWRIRSLQARERELSVRVEEAIAQIKTLRGLLPICASCKKIRDDSGYWNQMETFISDHSGADFSHSICPDCMVKLYPDYASQQQQG